MATPGSNAENLDGVMAMVKDANGKAAHVPLGSLSDAAWDGTGDPASLIALWKYIGVQLAAVATNTEPA